MTTLEEIKQAMKTNDITQQEIADDLGLEQQTVGAWFSRGKIPKARYEAFMKSFNARVKKANTLSYGVESKTSSVVEGSSNSISVKLYDMSVSAGVGFEIDSVHEMPFTEMVIDRSLIPSHIMSSEIVAMKVDGRSMVPTILPNEIVLYKEEIGRYSGDALYVVNFGGMLMVKKIQFNPENGKYDIISENPNFKSYSVDMADNQTTFIIIGKVIANIQQ